MNYAIEALEMRVLLSGAGPKTIVPAPTASTAPSIVSSNQATFYSDDPSDNFAIFTSGSPTPSLSEIGPLPAGLTFSDNGNSVGFLQGEPKVGEYNFTIIAGNGVSPDAEQDFTLDVVAGFDFDKFGNGANGPIIYFTQGIAGTYSIYTGLTTPIEETGTLPSGLAFNDNPATGVATLSGATSANVGGVEATLTFSSGSKQVNDLFVVGNPPPFITADHTANTNGSDLFIFTVKAASDALGVAPNITETGVLPVGVSFTPQNNGTAFIGGTPAVETPSSYVITLTATPGTSAVVGGTQLFTLYVDESPPQVPIFNTLPIATGQFCDIESVVFADPAPTLTELGALPPGLSFVDNGGGTFSFVGIPSAIGTYAFSLVASNGIGPAVTRDIQMVVGASPVINSPNIAGFIGGANNTFAVTASGSPTVTFREQGALPSGVSFNNATGLLTGEPFPLPGSYALTLSAINAFGTSASQHFTLIVGTPPTIVTPNSFEPVFTPGSSETFMVAVDGEPAPTVSEIGALPAGLSFTTISSTTSTSAYVTGVATSAEIGTYALTFTASNVCGTAAPKVFLLTVNQITYTSPGGATFYTGRADSFQVSTISNTPCSISEIGALPSGVSLTEQGSNSALLSGTPSPDAAGTYLVTLEASNGIGPPIGELFTLTVVALPNFTSNSSTVFHVGTFDTYTVTTTGSPTCQITNIGALPPDVSFTDNGDGTATITDTPSAADVGDYLLTLEATNANGYELQYFGIEVDVPPAFTNTATSATFNAGQSANPFYFYSTGDPAPTLSETGTIPSGMSFLAFNSGYGYISGTPAQGSGGVYPITLIASNGADPPVTQLLTLNVDELAGFASVSAPVITAGVPVTYTIEATGFPFASLAEDGNLPAGVSFTDNGNGTGMISGTPDTTGVFPITITADNGLAPPATESISLTVTEAPAITSSATAQLAVGRKDKFAITTVGYPAPSFTDAGTLPSGLTFTDDNNGVATISGTPSAADEKLGPYSLIVTAANGIGSPATQTLTFQFANAAAPAITSVNHATYGVSTTASIPITATGFPTPTLSEVGALPAGLSFTANSNGTALVAGTVGPGAGGQYTLSLTATSSLGTAKQTFTLTIDQPQTFTGGAAATFTTGTKSSFQIQTTGFPLATFSISRKLPSGLALTNKGNNTALISGSPGATTGGTYALTLTASNGLQKITEPFTLTIDQPPKFSTANHATFLAGQSDSFTVKATGYPTPAFGSNALPDGIMLNDNGDGSASLSGVPSTPGVYKVTLTATNAAAAIPQVFTLTIDQPPQITSNNSATFTAAQSYTFVIQTSGYPRVILKESGALPSGVKFKTLSGGSAELVGKPTILAAGKSYSLVLTASNGVLPTATQDFTLNVPDAAIGETDPDPQPTPVPNPPQQSTLGLFLSALPNLAAEL